MWKFRHMLWQSQSPHLIEKMGSLALVNKRMSVGSRSRTNPSLPILWQSIWLCKSPFENQISILASTWGKTSQSFCWNNLPIPLFQSKTLEAFVNFNTISGFCGQENNRRTIITLQRVAIQKTNLLQINIHLSPTETSKHRPYWVMLGTSWICLPSTLGNQRIWLSKHSLGI